MFIIYLILAALLVYLSLRSFTSGLDYLRYFREELAKPRSEWTPKVTIIAPCKGFDHGLSENFDALLQQDHPNYQVVFVVDDGNDSAAAVIAAALNDSRAEGKLVVAPTAVESSQKVENLREGVMHADPQSIVFVFFDSDVRPSEGWLRALIAPLEDEAVGAATGYRWFVPEPSTFAGELRSAWNASIASALGPNEKSNFCWGGSMAIRRDVFDRLDIRDAWRGTLSDDFAVTRAMRRARLPIHFVPQALTASLEPSSFRGLFEFTNRQMKITRVYAPHLWLLSFFGSSLFCGVILWSLILLTVRPIGGIQWWAAFSTLLLVSVFSFAKAWLRHAAVRLAMPEHDRRLARQLPWQCSLWLLTPPIFLFNCISALVSTRLVWRGIEYEMTSATATRLIGRN